MGKTSVAKLLIEWDLHELASRAPQPESAARMPDTAEADDGEAGEPEMPEPSP